MYDIDRQFMICKIQEAKDKHIDKELIKHCAINDLIAGDSFSNCDFCIWADCNLDEFYGNTVLCNRCVDLGAV
jgi:hypothetical protein